MRARKRREWTHSQGGQLTAKAYATNVTSLYTRPVPAVSPANHQIAHCDVLDQADAKVCWKGCSLGTGMVTRVTCRPEHVTCHGTRRIQKPQHAIAATFFWSQPL